MADGTRTQAAGVRKGTEGIATEGSTAPHAPSIPQKFPEKFPGQDAPRVERAAISHEAIDTAGLAKLGKRGRCLRGCVTRAPDAGPSITLTHTLIAAPRTAWCLMWPAALQSCTPCSKTTRAF